MVADSTGDQELAESKRQFSEQALHSVWLKANQQHTCDIEGKQWKMNK